MLQFSQQKKNSPFRDKMAYFFCLSILYFELCAKCPFIRFYHINCEHFHAFSLWSIHACVYLNNSCNIEPPTNKNMTNQKRRAAKKKQIRNEILKFPNESKSSKWAKDFEYEIFDHIFKVLWWIYLELSFHLAKLSAISPKTTSWKIHLAEIKASTMAFWY